MNAQSRYKNAPALDFARECGIILLKGNAVVQRSDLTTDQGFLDDDRLGYEPSGHRAFTRKMYSTMTAQIKAQRLSSSCAAPPSAHRPWGRRGSDRLQ